MSSEGDRQEERDIHGRGTSREARVRPREESGRARGSDERGDEVLEKIAQMPEPDGAMATRLHALMKEVAPGLSPKTCDR